MKTKLALNLFVILNLLLAALPAQGTPVVSSAPADLLQLNAGGHALGFATGGMYAATGDHALHIDFEGANAVRPQADSPASSDDQAAYLNQVMYADLWKGVTLTYTAEAGSVYTTTYTLAAGADPADIRLRYNAPLSLNEDGTMNITFETGILTESAPVAWQEIRDQRIPVDVSFRIRGQAVGFALGSYDPHYALTIDPSLVWNTFLGGSSSDYGYGIAVDGSGNVYVTGYSEGTWGSPIRDYTGSKDIFVAKLDSLGALTWNTFLGGGGGDRGYGIAVDGSGNSYVTGYSTSTWGCSPASCTVRAYSGGLDAFAAKLNSSGVLTWNTFLGGYSTTGGNSDDYGTSIAVDGSGNSYVTGYSGISWGSPVHAYGAGDDAFAAKLNSSGTLTWNTFMGGSSSDYGYGIAVDVSGNVYVAGESTASWGSPVRAYTGGVDAFAAKLDFTGGLTWNTFLGGSGEDRGTGVAVDGSGNIYVSGYSATTWGSPVGLYTGGYDAFAAKLDFTGGLTWNTFLGGSGSDSGYGVAVDGSGNVYIAGQSNATWGSPERAYTSGMDAFAAKIDSSGALTSNTFLGGTFSDYATGIAVAGSGNIYMTGYGNATWGSPVRAYSGSGYDGFAAKVDLHEYTLAITSAHGTVARNPNQATYHEGDVVQLTATPSTGWSFSNWTGGLTGSVNPDSVTIHGNTSVTAHYTINTYQLRVGKIGTGSGTITSNPAGIDCGSTCIASYNYNTSVTLSAIAATGSNFTGWSGGGCSGTGTCTVIMSDARLVKANFTLYTYALSVSKTGAGSGSVTSNLDGIDCGSTCSHLFDYNTSVTLTATAATGSTFTGWSGSGCSHTGTCTVTMDAARSVTANFTQNDYTLTVTSAHGTVAKSPNQATYHEGDVVQLTAAPDAGWSFANWTGGLISSSNPDSVAIHGNMSVTANFTLNIYQIFLPLVVR